MGGKVKTFHANLLKGYIARDQDIHQAAVDEGPPTSSSAISAASLTVIEDIEGEPCNDSDCETLPELGGWGSNETVNDLQYGDQLTLYQRRQLEEIASLYYSIFSDRPATKILANRRTLKGTGVALAEDLTKTNLDRLHKVKALEGVKSAWSKKGTICACGHNGKILKFEPKCSLGVFNDLLKTTTKPFKRVHRPPQSTRMQGQERQLQKATIDSLMSQASVVRKSNSDGDLSAIFPTRGTHLTMNDQQTSPGPRQSTPHSEIISNGTKSITCTSVQNKLLDIANGEKED
ncbi:hypothetical protein ElyMa_005984600 [Elysia marginata]|uniref:BEN domain-containing protein n=1 Tax=Elysia marginata TaxID=1093978 RepID=A0AAV4GDS3_9GAST|nr:hypothetical protein ElyMa_005984600 [Elysia marginata]